MSASLVVYEWKHIHEILVHLLMCLLEHSHDMLTIICLYICISSIKLAKILEFHVPAENKVT